MKKAFQINKNDNVATVIQNINLLEEIEIVSMDCKLLSKIIANKKINSGHKIAIINLDDGEEILKYGEVIGIASTRIYRGDWVHTHNLVSNRMSFKNKERTK